MITIGSRKIGTGQMLFIIAEMFGNHNQLLERALEMVEAYIPWEWLQPIYECMFNTDKRR